MTRRINKAGVLSRRAVLESAAGGALAAGLGPLLWVGGCKRAGQAKRPNVVFVVVDTLRSDHVSCCGSERNTTPNIDRLAKDSVLFTNGISASPWTLPSVASMLTGRYPCALGMREQIRVIPEGEVTLAEVLKRNGYSTYGVVSHTLVSGRLGFGRGFDKYDEQSCFGHGGISSPAVTRKADSFVQEAGGNPFFLFLHYFDPHYNYVLHNEYNYYPSYTGGIRSNHPILDLWQKRHEFSEEDVRYLSALYDSEVSFTDSFIGHVIEVLRSRGLYDNSIIIVTSDHGEEFMERGWLGHTITLHQELIRVPLVMKLPGVKGDVVDRSVGLIDLGPTLCNFLGLEAGVEMDGGAIDLGRGGLGESRPIFSSTFNPQRHRPEKVEAIALRSVISGGKKLIYDEVKNERFFYDLSADPKEIKNLAGVGDEEYRGLVKLMADWIAEMEAEWKQLPGREGTELLTPEQREQLKSLGYL